MTTKRQTPLNMKSSVWSDLAVHQTMVRDKRRMQAYREAVCARIRADDVVLDMGCGTGILSMFAAQAGCRKIYAVDQSDIIQYGKRLAEANGFQDKITFIQKDLFDFVPDEPIDVLIHEQVGGFIWDEGFVSKVAHLRPYLSENAEIIPERIEVFAVPTSTGSAFDDAVHFWSGKHYGLDLSPIAHDVFMCHAKKALIPSVIQLTDTSSFLAEPRQLCTVDLKTDIAIPDSLSASWTINRPGELRGLCVYFMMHLNEDVCLSTVPQEVNTHWGQIFIPRFNPTSVTEGMTISVTLMPHEDPEQWQCVFESKTKKVGH